MWSSTCRESKNDDDDDDDDENSSEYTVHGRVPCGDRHQETSACHNASEKQNQYKTHARYRDTRDERIWNRETLYQH